MSAPLCGKIFAVESFIGMNGNHGRYPIRIKCPDNPVIRSVFARSKSI